MKNYDTKLDRVIDSFLKHLTKKPITSKHVHENFSDGVVQAREALIGLISNKSLAVISKEEFDISKQTNELAVIANGFSSLSSQMSFSSDAVNKALNKALEAVVAQGNALDETAVLDPERFKGRGTTLADLVRR